MKHTIFNNINRISLHDSSILSFEIQNDRIVLKFDWAKINDYSEDLKSLVLGNCELRLNTVSESFLEKESHEASNRLMFPNNFSCPFEEILENVSTNDNELKLSGFMVINGNYVWASWIIKFDCFEFLWDNHVTLEEWKNGVLPK